MTLPNGSAAGTRRATALVSAGGDTAIPRWRGPATILATAMPNTSVHTEGDGAHDGLRRYAFDVHADSAPSSFEPDRDIVAGHGPEASVVAAIGARASAAVTSVVARASSREKRLRRE